MKIFNYDLEYRHVEARLSADDKTVMLFSADGFRLYGMDGFVVTEVRGESPYKSLYEEFTTDEIKITAPLYGPPLAYNLQTGKQICELKKDAYLT